MPIDHLLRSLAQDQKALAIGVVLSGTESDGALAEYELAGNFGTPLFYSAAARRMQSNQLTPAKKKGSFLKWWLCPQNPGIYRFPAIPDVELNRGAIDSPQPGLAPQKRSSCVPAWLHPLLGPATV